MNEDSNTSNDPLLAAARQLPQSIAPERDLWPGIESELTAAHNGSGWFAKAAAVLLLVGTTAALTYQFAAGPGAEQPPMVAKQTNGVPVEDVRAASPAAFTDLNFRTASFGDRYSLGPDFVDARADLFGRLEDELEKLSPESRQVVIDNLATIQKATREINKALATEPENVLLQRLLLSTYQRELDMLTDINGLTPLRAVREDI